MPCCKIMKVVLASKNPHKLEEIAAITSRFGMELVLQSQLGLALEVEENGSSFEENSYIKARAVVQATGLPALADDSGLCVAALGGQPGIYTARYGFDDTLDDRGRRQLLLKNLGDAADRSAKFVCVITLLTPQGQCIQARGEAHGRIALEEAGSGGFGYDPIFYYPPLDKTFAQLTAQEKNRVSHRAEALKIFYHQLKEAGYADQ